MHFLDYATVTPVIEREIRLNCVNYQTFNAVNIYILEVLRKNIPIELKARILKARTTIDKVRPILNMPESLKILYFLFVNVTNLLNMHVF